MTTGKLASPYCMKNSKAFTLKHDRKMHGLIVIASSSFWTMSLERRNAFWKNKVESDPSLPLIIGHQIWERVSQLPKVTKASPSKILDMVLNIIGPKKI